MKKVDAFSAKYYMYMITKKSNILRVARGRISTKPRNYCTVIN